ncbi:MAG: hypothetical protein JJU27_19460 [Gammaproteobacteria bacterium]|nr:hypothetical protein [Gammaproteobacteria bacterium]
MTQVIQRIADTVHAQETPLISLAIPYPMDLAGGSHETGLVDCLSYPDHRPSALTDRVMESFERAGVPAIDLFKVFGYFPAEDLYYRGGDDHWNDDGQDVAARAVFEFLAKDHLPSNG